MVEAPDSVRKFFSEMGAKGGKVRGPSKKRSPEHYAKMVEARQAQRKARRENG